MKEVCSRHPSTKESELCGVGEWAGVFQEERVRVSGAAISFPSTRNLPSIRPARSRCRRSASRLHPGLPRQHFPKEPQTKQRCFNMTGNQLNLIFYEVLNTQRVFVYFRSSVISKL